MTYCSKGYNRGSFVSKTCPRLSDDGYCFADNQKCEWNKKEAANP